MHRNHDSLQAHSPYKVLDTKDYSIVPLYCALLNKYTFPEIIQANFFPNPRNSTNTIYPGLPTLPHEIAVYWLARDILLGKLFAFMDPMTEDQAWWKEVAKMLAIRKVAAPWIGHGVFRDTVDVSHADTPLEVKTYRWLDGNHSSTLIAILNPGKRSGAKIAIRFGLDSSRLRAFRLDPDGSKQRISLSVTNDQATFTSDVNFLSMVVIEARYDALKQ